MNLQALRERTHEQCLNARNMDRIIHTLEFGEAFKLVNNNFDTIINNKLSIFQNIKDLNCEAIQGWIDQSLCMELGELSIRRLRQVAKELNIPYYTSQSKDSLLIAIMQLKAKRKETIAQQQIIIEQKTIIEIYNDSRTEKIAC